MPRKRLEEEGGAYFSKPPSSITFIPTGCTLLDCVLGGGYPLGRVCNIVGDKSSGKTLLGIEACANFAKRFPNGELFYNEVEAAFDVEYAESLGLPVDRVIFSEEGACSSVEDFYEDLTDIIGNLKESGNPGLFILDSLDALSDRAELERDIGDKSFGAQKAKKMSEVFRRIVRDLNGVDIHLMIISQVRDNIGVVFGEKFARSGGRALDFYASQTLWLSQGLKLKRTIKKVERVVGVKITAKCKKNKIAAPFRDCKFDIIFGYGVDNITANLSWLKQIGRYDEIGLEEKEIGKIIRVRFIENTEELKKLNEKIDKLTRDIWYEIEDDFMPKVPKYP